MHTTFANTSAHYPSYRQLSKDYVTVKPSKRAQTNAKTNAPRLFLVFVSIDKVAACRVDSLTCVACVRVYVRAAVVCMCLCVCAHMNVCVNACAWIVLNQLACSRPICRYCTYPVRRVFETRHVQYKHEIPTWQHRRMRQIVSVWKRVGCLKHV